MLEKRGIRLILTKSKENVTMMLQKSYSFVNYNKNVLTKDKIIYNIDIQKREIKSVVSISFCKKRIRAYALIQSLFVCWKFGIYLYSCLDKSQIFFLGIRN